jgi:hypothetical protein
MRDQPLPTPRKSFEIFLSIFVKKTSPSWCSADCQPADLRAIAIDKGYEIGTIDEAEWPYERGLCLKVLERSLRLRMEAFEEDRPEPLIDGRLIRDVCTGRGTEPALHDYRPYLDDFFGLESSDDGQSSDRSVASSDDGQSLVASSDDGQSSVESSDDGQSSVGSSSDDEGRTRLRSLWSTLSSPQRRDGTGRVGTGSGSITRALRRMRSRLTGRGGEPSQDSQSSRGDNAD